MQLDNIILQYYEIEDSPIEFKIRIEETKLLVIYGRHINGYFIALPGICISCEATDPTDVERNTIFLSQAGLRSDYARIVCKNINSEWNRVYNTSM